MSVRTGRFRRFRPFVAAAGAAVLVLGVVGPAQSQNAPTGVGTSSLTVVPAALGVDGLPAGVDTTLGGLVAEATNDDGSVARIALDGLAAAGDLAPSLDYSTADGDQRGSESRRVGTGGVGAAIDLVDWALESDADSAVARVAALGGDLTTPIGLGATIESQRVSTSATPSASGSAVDLAVTGVDLGLGDLLPAEVLDALPLSVVLDLVATLGIPLSADLADQIGSLDELQRTLEGAVAAAEDLDEAESLLDAAIADDPTLSALEDAVADAAADVEAAEATVADLEAQIAELEAELALLDPVTDLLEIEDLEAQIAELEADLADAEATLADAETALTDAEDDLDAALADVGSLDPAIGALLAQVEDLKALLQDLLGQLEGLLGGLDLSQLRLDLLDALTGASLLDLGSLNLELSTVANGTGGEGTVTCHAEGLTVLGTSVPSPSCDDIGAALSGLGDTIGDALAVLPVAAPVPDVTLAGPTASSSGLTSPDAQGVTRATSSITALSLGIGSVDLTAVLDDLVAELDGLVGELDALLTELDVDVDPVTDGLDLDALGRTDTDAQATAVDVPADLADALGELRTALGELPLGDALDGLSTLGVGAELGSVVLSSAFSTTATPATPAAPGDPATPATPDSPELPRTGSSDHLMLMAALAALLAGVTTRALGRSFELGLHRAVTRHQQ